MDTPMKKTFVGILVTAGLVLTSCGSNEPPAPSEAELRARACEAFATATPGVYETSEAMDILADPGSTTSQRRDAMSMMADKKRTWPYDCDLPSDKARFDKFFIDAKAKWAESDK
ncbi:hypothetical protein ATN37_25780 [Rhodococcus sp. MH15]|nr:hypothetical protein [Rhodococcus sp. MH15]